MRKTKRRKMRRFVFELYFYFYIFIFIFFIYIENIFVHLDLIVSVLFII